MGGLVPYGRNIGALRTSRVLLISIRESERVSVVDISCKWSCTDLEWIGILPGFDGGAIAGENGTPQ